MLIVYLILLIPTLLIIYLILLIIWSIYYNKNYVTIESTPEHDKGWDKCYICKAAPPEIYYRYNIFGRTYRCLKHINEK